MLEDRRKAMLDTTAVKKAISKIKLSIPVGGHETGTSREDRIAVAAYYRAQRRGFTGGDPVADWLAAEAEVDAGIYNPQ
jgi:Protein of unknown function (DUF2934)